jgi:hypothetical protein
MISNRRSEDRFEAHGDVQLYVTEPLASMVPGRLMDISRSGFRMAHHCNTLSPGQLVHFRHDRAQGEARVVWNRIENGSVETGFVLCEPRV